MRKKKKLFFLILVGLLFLTGCSEKEIKDIPEDKGSAVNGQLPAEKAVNELVSEAEKRESDQHVEDDVYPENKEQNISEKDIPEEYTDWVTIEELNLSYDIFVGLMMSTCNLQSECFWDYGIIKEKGTDTWTSANAEYANLCQEIYGINYEYISENTKEADERRLERDAGYKIVDISEDGGSVLIWQKDSWGSEVHLQIYDNNEKVNELISDELYAAMFFTFGQRFGIMAGWGKYYDLVTGESVDLLHKKLGGSMLWLNETGKIAAIIDREENDHILIFDIENQLQLYEFDLCDVYCGNDEFSIYISQLKGNEESGKVLFYSSTSSYQLLYPEGRIEKLGDYMYHGSYSPDEQYFIYTSPDEGILLSAGQDNLYDIPKGIYVKKVGTSETAFVPIERSNHDLGLKRFTSGGLVKKNDRGITIGYIRSTIY